MEKKSICRYSAYIFLIFYSFASAYFLYSCKKEPARSVSPAEIMQKISESGFVSQNLEILPSNSEKKFGQEEFASIYGEENFDASQLSESSRGWYETENKIGEVGIFKLLDKDHAEKYRGVFTRYASDMQEYYSSKGETGKAKVANTAEVRDYGDYVYYAICDAKDKVFGIIESELGGKQ